MKFSPYFFVEIPLKHVGGIRTRQAKREIREFESKLGVKFRFYHNSSGILVKCTGGVDRLKEAQLFLRKLMNSVGSIGLEGDGSLHSLAPDIKVTKTKRCRPMARYHFARRGTPITLLTNHFKVNVGSTRSFFRYSVSITYEDNSSIKCKDIGRKCIEKVCETCFSELGGKDMAYDGEKNLFTVKALPHNKNQFVVVLEDLYSNRVPANGSPGHNGSPNQDDSKAFKVEINFAAEIPVRAIAKGLWGDDSKNPQDALGVFDIILRQNATEQVCPLVRPSFCNDNSHNYYHLGMLLKGRSGFHSCFRAAQGGLYLNMDISRTVTVWPRSVIGFLLENQNVMDPYGIDWEEAKRSLKNLRVKAFPTNMEYQITGLSEVPCYQQLFPLWQKKDGEGDTDQVKEITVFEYFVNIKHIGLSKVSADVPCINVGTRKKPIFFPVELCLLVSLPQYTKVLSTLQRSHLIEKSRQKPDERMEALTHDLRVKNYNEDRMCGISIDPNFTQIVARVLSAPKLICGNGEEISPQNGRWNFKNNRLLLPKKVENWAIINFSTQRCDIPKLWKDLVRCGQQKGMEIAEPLMVIEETPQNSCRSPVDRVKSMFKIIKDTLPGRPELLLCLLPERKTSAIYGPWKKINLADNGIITQCIAPHPEKLNDRYLTNVLLKINAKLGGLNSLLAMESLRCMPLISKSPTMIIGMNVSHGSDRPSIASVVSSRHWPLISRYGASARTQPRNIEMIDSLFKQVSDNVDEGIIREHLLDFCASTGNRKPDQIVIFRSGVSESQFNQVLNIELGQIIQACKLYDANWSPKFTLIVAQRNHHTKFFQKKCTEENVPPGTVVDYIVSHPRNNDFYMCSHNGGAFGLSRPRHYHVLLDEIEFSADDLQELVYSLSYVCQRSTSATSDVAPLRYARLASAQVAQLVKLDEKLETSSGNGGNIPKLHEKVSSSMFFC